MKRPRQGIVVYAAALLGVGAATAIRFALDPILGEHMMFSMYFLAVTVAAWAGGIRPAMVTAILCSILANYLFSDPRGHLEISNTEEFCGLIVFLSVSLLIGVLCEISLRSMDRARAAEQQKDDFLAILAHELRNPLAVIHYTNLAEQRAGLQESDGRMEVIDRQVQHLDQMIEDLLDISRVSRGKFRLQFEAVSVKSIVDEALVKVWHYIEQRGHELRVDRSEDEMHVWGDPLRLQQVLSNLLRNAAHSTPRGGRISLEVRSENGSAMFRVQDNGHGMAKDMLERVFDLHTQAERTLESSGTGPGVGLALSRTLVELHGGSLTAASEGPGRGSEFIMRLPLHKFAEAPVREAS
jgi:signal transduction histidine kinase